MRGLFEKLVTKHGLAMGDPGPNDNTCTTSFAALIGREPDVVAYQARLADVVVVAHPASDREVSSSDALHAVLFDSAKPVLIAPNRPANSWAADMHRLEWFGRTRLSCRSLYLI